MDTSNEVIDIIYIYIYIYRERERDLSLNSVEIEPIVLDDYKFLI